MAVIKYDELFDFPGYTKAIKDAETANVAFGKTVGEIVTRISAQTKSLTEEYGEFIGVLKSFNVNQKGAADTIIRTGEAAVGASKKIAEQKRVMGELVGTVDLTTKSVNELKSGLKGLEGEYSSIAGKSDDARAKKAALAQEARRLKAALKEETDALKASSKVLDAAEGSYQSFQNELASIGKQLKSMPDAFDKLTGKININNKEAVNLSKRYLEINTTLKTADAALGNYQRNVGNYASGFAGLNNSVNQITRELPALGINLQTFFLAVSNNLPILFDQLKQTKTEIAAMRAEGLKAPSVLQAFGKAVFSLGTLLSVGVTLLTLYGAKVVNFIAGLFKTKSALSEYQKAQKLTNELQVEGIKNYATEAAKLQIVQKLLNDATIPAAKRVRIAKEYNETADKTNQIDLKQIDNLSSINVKIASQIELIKQRGLARAAESIIAQRSEALLLAEEKAKEKSLKTQANVDAVDKSQGLDNAAVGIRNPDGTFSFRKSEALENLGREQEIANRVNKDPAVIKAREDLRLALSIGNKFLTPEGVTGSDAKDKGSKNKVDLIKQEQDLLKSALEKAIALEELNYQKGLATEEEFQIKKLGLIQKYAAAAIESENKRKKPDQSTINDFNKEKINAEVEYQKYINDLIKDARKEDLENAKESIKAEGEFKAAALKSEHEDVLQSKSFTDKEKEGLELDYQNRIDAILIDSLDRRIALETDAAKKVQLEKEKLDLETGINARNRKADDKAVEDKYQTEIKAAKGAFDIIRAGRDTSFKEELAFLEKLKAIKLKYAKETAEEELQIAEMKAEYERQLREELEETIYNSIQTGLQIAQNIVDGKFEERIANLEVQRQKELDLAGNNAAARAAIEEKFQRRIAEQKNKQARADRNFALFNIAISTAQGIAKNIAEFGMPFAIPFIAMTAIAGALQAAVVLSRPLPKYKKGRKGGPAEYAIVDEEGPELIVDSKGRLREMGGNGPRLTKLQSGDSVITATDTKQVLKSMEVDKIVREIQLTSQLSSSFRSGKQDEMIYVMSKAMQSGSINQEVIEKAFEKAIGKVPKSDFFMDERGFRKRITEQNQKITYLNSLTNING